MIVSYRSLLSFLSVASIPTAEDIGKSLTSAGFELDSLQAKGDDRLLELNVTPNRGDCFSHLGVARELAVILGGQLHLPPVQELPENFGGRTIALADGGCPYYVGVWLKLRERPKPLNQSHIDLLEGLGMRSIDPIVDLTNVVMLELGQPLHAFAADKLQGAVTVRPANDGEAIVTLDGQTRPLQAGQLTIADGSGPIAIAGVMGGTATEVDGDSMHILLESAHFLPERVSRSRRQAGLSTEASMRFERGVDPAGCERAAGRFLQLLSEHCAYEIVAVHRAGQTPEGVVAPWQRAQAEKLLGALPDATETERILTALGFAAAGEPSTRRVPSWRFDVRATHDMAEEVARIWGYDKIEPTLPSAQIAAARSDGDYARRERMVDWLVAAGFQHAIHYSFGADAAADAVLLKNPLGEQTRALRTSLGDGLLAAVAANQRRQEPNVRLVEIGKVFRAGAKGAVDERWRLGLIASGAAAPNTWFGNTPVGYYELKGALEGLLSQFGISSAAWRIPAQPDARFHPGKVAELTIGGRHVGCLGELDTPTQEAFDLMHPAIFGEFDADAICAAAAGVATPRHAPLPKFPRSERDLAFVLDRAIPAVDVADTLRTAIGENLEYVYVFDVYEGKGIESGQKSVGFRVALRHPDRTLEQAEVDAAVARAVEAVMQRHGGKLRG